MPRKYGLRDKDGNVTLLSEEDYKKEYQKRMDANKIYAGEDPKGMMEGQQPRVRQNKGEGLFVEGDDEEEAVQATAPKKQSNSPLQRFRDNSN